MFWAVKKTKRSDGIRGFSFGWLKLLSFFKFKRRKVRKDKNICSECRVTIGRMIRSQEQDEFIAVRVQDPRLQNEGSWNSYVDFKIFLHTNSKAFTAKTSCVRRRYSEFVWLKKKLQKNAGLVPVPDLPRKSIFSFINDDFIERRRKGLQTFLDKVLHMTVCLSDSQLHLFLQTQLPVKHIEDCVQGHTPYTVTEAILTYASSNQGWVQEEGAGDPESWPVPYESVESPTPHVPVGAVSIEERPRNEPSDFSEVELSDVEKTEPDRQKRSDSVINLIVEVHQKHPVENIDGEESGPEPMQLEKNDFQNECENLSPALPIEKPQYGQPQNQGLIEVLDEDEVRVIENRTLRDKENNTEGQEAEPEQKDIDKNLLQKDPSLPSVDYDEITLDLIAVQEDNQEQTDKVLGSSIHSIDAPHEDVKICDESLMNTKDAEEKNDVVQQNEAGDEDFTASPVQEIIRSETSWEHSEIKETCLSSSSSDSDEDDVSEVNKLNAKHAQTERAVLILEEIEEGLKMETDPVTEIMHNISPVSNLDANIAQLDSLVL